MDTKGEEPQFLKEKTRELKRRSCEAELGGGRSRIEQQHVL